MNAADWLQQVDGLSGRAVRLLARHAPKALDVDARAWFLSLGEEPRGWRNLGPRTWQELQEWARDDPIPEDEEYHIERRGRCQRCDGTGSFAHPLMAAQARASELGIEWEAPAHASTVQCPDCKGRGTVPERIAIRALIEQIIGNHIGQTVEASKKVRAAEKKLREAEERLEHRLNACQEIEAALQKRLSDLNRREKVAIEHIQKATTNAYHQIEEARKKAVSASAPPAQ